MNESLTADKRKERYIDWVKRVLKFLSETGPKLGEKGTHCATFQSKPVLDKQPDVVFLGYNPNEPWEFYQEEIEPDRFNNGNPAFNNPIQRKKMKVWKYAGAFEWAEYTKPVTDGNFVFFNAIYFGTKKIDDFIKIPGSAEAIEQCNTFTEELIHDIFQPKCIVCFSVSHCFDMLNRRFKFDDVKSIDTAKSTDPELLEFALTKEKDSWKSIYSCKDTVMKGYWKGIPVYGVPHPSNRNINYDDLGAVALYLRSEMQKIL